MMNTRMQSFFYWSPRLLAILFAVFVGLFALDVFDLGYGFWETMLGLLIHLIPTWVILIVLLIAWRWEWVGGIMFPLVGLAFFFRYGGLTQWGIFYIFTIPLLVIGALFFISWFYRAHPRTSS